MASLVDELIIVLEEEERIYKQVASYGEQKTQILIAGDVPALEKLTSLEQLASDELFSQSNKQSRMLQDIATVLGKDKDGEPMTVTKLIGCLANQPDVQMKLTVARDNLLAAAKKTTAINKQNEALLKQAIELTEFDLTLFRSLRQAPETANYNRNAYNTGSILGSGGFDAKQ